MKIRCGVHKPPRTSNRNVHKSQLVSRWMCRGVVDENRPPNWINYLCTDEKLFSLLFCVHGGTEPNMSSRNYGVPRDFHSDLWRETCARTSHRCERRTRRERESLHPMGCWGCFALSFRHLINVLWFIIMLVLDFVRHVHTSWWPSDFYRAPLGHDHCMSGGV